MSRGRVTSPAHYSLHRALLNAIRFRHREVLRYIHENPISMLRFLEVPDGDLVFFSRSYYQPLLAIIRESWLEDVFIFAGLTGKHRGEIINLQWKDIAAISGLGKRRPLDIVKRIS